MNLIVNNKSGLSNIFISDQYYRFGVGQTDLVHLYFVFEDEHFLSMCTYAPPFELSHSVLRPETKSICLHCLKRYSNHLEHGKVI